MVGVGTEVRLSKVRGRGAERGVCQPGHTHGDVQATGRMARVVMGRKKMSQEPRSSWPGTVKKSVEPSSKEEDVMGGMKA